MPLTEAAIDDDLHGIYFTVGKPGEYCLGWQADLKTGDACQEFRADRVSLMQKDSNGVYGLIEETAVGPDFSQPFEAYTLQGVKISRLTPGSCYIIRQGDQVA